VIAIEKRSPRLQRARRLAGRRHSYADALARLLREEAVQAHGEALAGICPANTTHLVAGFIPDVPSRSSSTRSFRDDPGGGRGRRDGCRLPVTDGHEPRKVIVLSELILPPPSYARSRTRLT
jgi:hypothetical protein